MSNLSIFFWLVKYHRTLANSWTKVEHIWFQFPLTTTYTFIYVMLTFDLQWKLPPEYLLLLIRLDLSYPVNHLRCICCVYFEIAWLFFRVFEVVLCTWFKVSITHQVGHYLWGVIDHLHCNWPQCLYLDLNNQETSHFYWRQFWDKNNGEKWCHWNYFQIPRALLELTANWPGRFSQKGWLGLAS